MYKTHATSQLRQASNICAHNTHNNINEEHHTNTEDVSSRILPTWQNSNVKMVNRLRVWKVLPQGRCQLGKVIWRGRSLQILKEITQEHLKHAKKLHSGQTTISEGVSGGILATWQKSANNGGQKNSSEGVLNNDITLRTTQKNTTHVLPRVNFLAPVLSEDLLF